MDLGVCVFSPCVIGTFFANYSKMNNFTSTYVYNNKSNEDDNNNNSSTNNNNNTFCIPAGVMHEQIGVDNIYVQAAFGLAYGAVWFSGVSSNILTLIVAFTIITGRGPAAQILLAAQADNYHNGAPKSNGGGGNNNLNVGQQNRRGGVGKPSFTVRTVFVGSLACSDLLTAMTSLPVTAVNLFTEVWPFPAFVCPSVGFMQAFSIFQSSFTFTAIAVDRFLVILFSDGPWAFTYRTARLVVAATALLAFALAFPMFAFVSVVPMPPMCGEFCLETWPDWLSSIINQRSYGVFQTGLQFGLPAVVTALCYFAISRFLGKAQKVRLEKFRIQSKSERRANDRRRRANGMMISMICCFVCLWSPFNALNILRDFGIFPYLFDWSLFGIMYAVAHLIAMTSVVWNPFIYAWYNRSIREAVLALLRACRCRPLRWSSQPPNYQSSSGANNNLIKRRRSSMMALSPMMPIESKDVS